MPYGGNDWLALTQEATVEPEIPICDPHHHFWDFRSERIPYQHYLLQRTPGLPQHRCAAELDPSGQDDGDLVVQFIDVEHQMTPSSASRSTSLGVRPRS